MCSEYPLVMQRERQKKKKTALLCNPFTYSKTAQQGLQHSYLMYVIPEGLGRAEHSRAMSSLMLQLDSQKRIKMYY